MTKYFCTLCNYDAKQKSNYLKHLLTKKHQKVVNNSEHLVNNSEHLVNNSEHLVNNGANVVNIASDNKIVCKYCKKEFTTNTSKYRHIRTVCKKSKDEDVNHIVDLLNKKSNVLKTQEGMYTYEQNRKVEDKLEKMDHQINKMMKKLQITNINNTNTIIQNNYHLNDYNNPDLSHLTSGHYTKALKENNMCVPEIIKMIYFNESKPENMSIYIPGLKDKYVCLVTDGTWTTKCATDVIPNFNEYNYYILREWLDENNDQIPEYIKHQFKTFEDNFYEEGMQEHAFKLLKYLLYDFRDIPKKYRKLT